MYECISLPVQGRLCASARVRLCDACSPLRGKWSSFNFHYLCLWSAAHEKYKHAYKKTDLQRLNNRLNVYKNYFSFMCSMIFFLLAGLVFGHIYNPPFRIKVLPDIRSWFMNWRHSFICVWVWRLKGKICFCGLTVRMFVDLPELCLGVCEHVWRVKCGLRVCRNSLSITVMRE